MQVNLYKKEGGFTLIELSIVILISGILISAFLSMALLYRVQLEEERLDEVVAIGKEAIISYEDYGRYPCPANPSLPIDDANYGLEDCSLPIVDGVISGIVPSRTIEKIENKITKVIEDVPVNLLSIVESKSAIHFNFTDPWGRPLLYAVTASMTAAGTFDYNAGVISITDEHGRNTGGINNNAHFVVYSLGKDNTCPAAGTESNNCNGDSNFVDGIRYTVNGANHYDDKVAYFTKRSVSLWSNHLDNNSKTVGDAKNDNTGNIGINTVNPQAKLHVNGNLRVSKDAIANAYCDNGTVNCINPISLQSDIKCSTDGHYIKAVTIDATTKRFVVQCGKLEFLPPPSAVDCSKKGGVNAIYTAKLLPECNY